MSSRKTYVYASMLARDTVVASGPSLRPTRLFGSLNLLPSEQSGAPRQPLAVPPGYSGIRLKPRPNSLNREPAAVYEVGRQIAEGGMALVFEGQSLREDATDRKVAIKVLRPEINDPNVRDRFRREAELLKAFQHPNILRCHDIFEGAETNSLGDPQAVFLALEFLAGEPLSDFIQRNHPIAPEMAVAILLPVLDALAYIHGTHGVFHRDLKPENIMIYEANHADGEGGSVLESLRSGDELYPRDPRREVVVKVMDFGLAAFDMDGSRLAALTREGSVVGTPEYMSPEQIRSGLESGVEIDARSDLYSLGVILYELLAGRPPFSSTSDKPYERFVHLGNQHLNVEPKSVRSRNPQISPGLDRYVCTELLAKEPSMRPQSAEDVAFQLERVPLRAR